MMAVLVTGVAVLAIIASFVYASWEEDIDRRRQQRLDARDAWNLEIEDWRVPANPARGRELAG